MRPLESGRRRRNPLGPRESREHKFLHNAPPFEPPESGRHCRPASKLRLMGRARVLRPFPAARATIYLWPRALNAAAAAAAATRLKTGDARRRRRRRINTLVGRRRRRR